LSQFFQLQKSQVLHEAKAFNDTPLDNRKCCSVLTELLCLLSQGEVLGKEEATTLFFGVTKLFQSQDPQLRRLVYLVIKELNKNQDDAFIVISSLEKDINGGVELFRANALRVHSQVIDSSMLEQRARLFRQAIVNKNDHIASSALCAGIRMFSANREVVKRWQNETREATKSSSKMVAFHALHLLYKMHATDRRAVMRLVTSMIARPPESPLARCLLIRYAFSCIGGGSGAGSGEHKIVDFIKEQIRNYKNPLVMLESAKCLCHLPNSTEQDLTAAMNVLQEFLNSPRPVQRFAAVRALSSIVNKFNNILSPSCTVDLEHLITDGNRNIATLAITTLLQTTAEYSIERLLQSITEFMNEIADELKIVLVTAIERVCAKFPKKYESLLNFLAMALREEGGYEYKNKIVDCMLLLMTSVDRAKEFGLDSLCEFIEDCEYPLLSVRILYLIGDLGPSTPFPSRYVRFIFNRVLLETPCVRAAAVSCLTKVAVDRPRLFPDIHELMVRSLGDEDDEVRDRATLYCAVLGNFKEIEAAPKPAAADDDDEEFVDLADDGEDGGDAKEVKPVEVVYAAPEELVGVIKVEPLPFSMEQLEQSLLVYLNDNEEREGADGGPAAFERPFSGEDVDKFLDEQRDAESRKKSIGGAPNGRKPQDLYEAEPAPADLVEAEWAEFVASKGGDLPALGPQLGASVADSLTEPEAEYQVSVVQRVFAEWVVLQFVIEQTIEAQLICDVYVEVDCDDTDSRNLTAPLIRCGGDSGIALCIMERGDTPYVLGKFECRLHFVVKDDGEDSQYEEGYEDEYALNPITLRHRAYVRAAGDDDVLSTRRLKEKWAAIGKEAEQRRTAKLSSFDTLQQAVDAMVEAVGLSPVEDSHLVDDPQATQHTVNLIAYTDSKEPICMRAAFVADPEHTVISYKAAVRCNNEVLRSECLHSF